MPSWCPGTCGWFETSLMLAAQPSLVRAERARHAPVEPPPLFDKPPYPGLTVERHGEWERVGGATDDAAGADAAHGERLLDRRARGLARAVLAFDAASRPSHDPPPLTRKEPFMKITEVDVHVVNLPLVNPFTSSFETKTGETRTVVRIRTDTGVEGWGETMWGRPVAAIVRDLAEDLIGTSPFALESFHRRHHMVPFFYGYLGYAALAAIDVACWDAMGKATGQSVTDLLGGPVRDEVPLTALITRADAPGAAAGDLPRALAEHTERVVAEGGFTAVKLKGTKDVQGDVAILRAVRAALPEVNLRVDPNAAWSVPDSIRA